MLELMGMPYPCPGLPLEEITGREGKESNKRRRRSGAGSTHCRSRKGGTRW